jgi:hypothetical protein
MLEFLERSEGMFLDAAVKFPPEIGGTNTLAHFTLLKKLHSICERFHGDLLQFSQILWLLFKQGRIPTLLQNPGNLSAMA